MNCAYVSMAALISLFFVFVCFQFFVNALVVGLCLWLVCDTIFGIS